MMKWSSSTFILFLFLIAAFFNYACATGSAIVTGTVRPAVDPSIVKLYTNPPSRYDVIGLVKASSDSGWTSQGSQDYAVQELKSQAARLGANGVLIRALGESTTGVVVSGGNGFFYGIPVTAQSISGEAIYVFGE